MAQRILWVVEMLINGRWEPTVGVSLSRRESRIERWRWMDDNPSDTFRVRPYRADEP